MEAINKKLSLVEEILRIRKDLPETFCPVPFTTIILEPDGKVGFCRNKGNNFPVGEFKFNNINEIWDIRNSPKAMQWRKEFLEGNVEICKTEVKSRKCNLDYPFNELLPHAELSEKLSSKVLRLTANFNGKCNMQCPFCIIWKLPNGNYTDENFWIPARESLFPFLKQIDMLSGEPFIQADTYKLMDIMGELNPECEWLITTNMYWTLNEKIESKLAQINLKSIAVSIDSLNEELYAKLRYPGKLKTTLNNLEAMFKYREKRKAMGKPFSLSFNFLVQVANWHELPEVLRFVRKNNMEIYLIMLALPSEFSILNLDEDKRREILNYYLSEIPRADLFKANGILMPLADSLSKLDKLSYLSYLSKEVK